jgi:uncharacterized membrane protein YdcZ (DUF606 family)
LAVPIALGLLATTVQAQLVNLYTFAQTAGTYTALSGGTQLIAPNTDDGSASATNIGFNFVFNGSTFTQFVANANGNMRLGNAAPASQYSPISTVGNTNAISPMGRDGRAGGGVFYQVQGVSPNQVLVVEWTTFHLTYSNANQTLDMQVRLYEGTNVVEFVYGNSLRASSYTGQVGLRGSSASTDFNNRTTTTNWAATTAGALSSATMTFSTTAYPAVGQTYTWTPPVIPDVAAGPVLQSVPACPTATEALVARVTNSGTLAIDMSTTPISASVVVTGAGSGTLTGSVNTGTLGVGATVDIPLTPTLDMTAAGAYNFATTLTMTGDGISGNNTSNSSITNAALYTVPQVANFNAFTDGALDTEHPGFSEGVGAAVPTGTTSAWASTAAAQNTAFGNSAIRLNLFGTSRNEWIRLPKVTLGSDDRLAFNARMTDVGTASADGNGGMTTTDDRVVVRISTNCGVSFTDLLTINAGNMLGITHSAYTEVAVPLSSYAGQTVVLAIYATDGPLDDVADYDFIVDDLRVENTPQCLVPTGLAISGITLTSFTATWNAEGNAGGYNWEVRTSGAAGSGPTGLVASGSTATTSINPSGLTPNTSYQVYVQSDCSVNGDGLSVWSLAANAYTGYCVPTVLYTGDYISDFSTTLGLTNITNNASGTSPGNYGDFTAMSVSAPENTSFNYSLAYVGGANGIRIWVDWDNDLLFEASEIVSSVGPGSSPQTGTVTVPAATPLGSYRMRVRAQWNAVPADACSQLNYGEAEDYTLTVVAPPTCPAPTGLAASATGTTSLTASWTAEILATGGYNWEVRTSGLPGDPGPTASGSEPGTTFSTSGLTANTTYYIYVQSDCDGSGNSVWAGPVSVFTGYCVPGPNSNLDTDGITNVTFANVNETLNTEADGGYTDRSAVVGNVGGPGANVPLSVLVPTGFTYDMSVWIDWDNDLVFDVPSELVAGGVGNESDGVNPWLTSFTVPLAQPAGQYRMRIGGADFSLTGPCFAGSWRAFADFTVSVCLPLTDNGSAVVDNCAGGDYQVSVTVNLNGAPTAMVNYSVNGVAQTPVAYAPGVLIGPFPVHQVVDVTVVGSTGCEVDLGRYHSACNIELDCNAPTPIEMIHCYDNGDTRTWTWVNTEVGGTVALKFVTGAMEATDNILLWEGAPGGTPATPPTLTGTLDGTLITSVGNTLSMSISTDGSNSCADGAPGLTAGWVFQARCGGCVEPTGFLTADPNGNGSPEVDCGALPEPTFNAYVGILDNGIDENTGLPPATVGYRLFVNGVPQPDVTGLPGGAFYLLGAFPLTTDIDVTLLHEDQIGQSACNNVLTPDLTVGYDACPPANDICANAEVLTLNPDGTCPANSVSGTTRGADQEGPLPECQSSGVAQDAWYTFNSGVSSSFTMTLTAGTAQNIGVQLFTACGTPAPGACLYNLLPAQNPVTITVAPGTDYWLRIFTDVSLGAAGTFNICVSAFDACANIGAVAACATNVQALSPAGVGAWDNYGGPWSTPGKERLFTFTPTTTGTHFIQVTAVSGGYTDFFYKDASIGCNSTSWTWIQDFISPGFSAGLTMTAGTQYYIMWDPESSSSAYDVTFRVICAAAPPANDECAGAVGLSVNGGTTCTLQTAGTIHGATASVDAIAPCTGSADDDVWYSFVATSNTHTVSLNNVTGSTTDLDIAVYSGACGALVNVACIDPNSGNVSGLTSGSTYYVRVYSYGTTPAYVNFDVCISTPPSPPANDNICGAIPLTVNPTCSYTTGTTTSASTSPEAAPGCAYFQGGDVWYSVVVPAGGSLTIDTQTGGITDSGMEVYTSSDNTCTGTLVMVDCDDDDSSNGLMSMVSLTGQTVGNTLFVRVWEYGNDNPGTFGICASMPPAAPANDNCAGAIALTVNPDFACGVTTAGTITGATASPEDQVGCGGTEDDDVWFSFVATNTSHRIDLQNVVGNIDLYHSLWTGGCGTLTLVSGTCSDPNLSNPTGLTPGTTYYLRVYTWTSSPNQSSTFNVCIGTPPPPPANDNCAGAVSLTPAPGLTCGSPTAGTLQSATNSGVAVAPCTGTVDDDVWYSFVATSNQHIITLSSITPSTTIYMQLFSGDCGTLTHMACSTVNAFTTPNTLVVGNTYYVRAYSSGSTPVGTTFNICVTTPPVGPPANDECAGALSVTVNTGQTCGSQTFGSVFGATASGNPVTPCVGTADDDVWFSFVALGPSHTVSLNSVTGSVTSMNFNVFSGSCGTLTNIGCGATGSAPSTVVSGLTAGNTYYVRVYTNTATGGQNTTFNVCVTSPPANDLCANAIAIDCNSTITGSTVGSTTTGNPGTCITALNGAGGVWYTVTGWGGPMTASLCGSSYDTKIGVLTGSCGTFTCETGNDDFCGLQSQATWTSVAGTTYYIYVTGYVATSVGPFTLSVTCGSTNPTCPANGLNLEFQNDGSASQVTWEVLNAGNLVVLSGANPVPNNQIGTQALCLPDGCYRLRVLDSGGDGMTTGGYELRTTGNERIIDNTNNFSTGSVSAISNNQTFCLPLGTDKAIWSSCDKLDWVNNKFIVCHANAAVSAQYGVTNATSGYEFWFFDPNGSYSFRRFRSHSTSDGYGSGANRACHFKVNGWVNSPATPHLPANVLLNVRVRGRVAGNNLAFGPACQFKIDAALAACPRVKLQDDPANVDDYSCGVSREFGGASRPANRIYATPPQPIPVVPSANVRYQFRFRIPGEGICIVRPPQTSARMVLSWNTGAPLVCSKTYEVDVRVSLDAGATWCFGPGTTDEASTCGDANAWGKVCLVTITCAPMDGGGNSMAPQGDGGFTMYPNPNRGDQLFVSVSHVEEGVRTVNVDIFDLTGKRVSARTIAVQDGFVKTNLDLNGDLAGGMYMVHVTAGDKTYTERLVIQP